jgi:hypothetical protein
LAGFSVECPYSHGIDAQISDEKLGVVVGEINRMSVWTFLAYSIDAPPVVL